MRKGLTLPNRAFDPYTPAELAALDDLQPSVLVLLLYGGAIDQTHIQQIQPYVESHIVRLLFRPYAGNIPQWAPADWAEECFHRSLGLPGMALPLAGEMIPANELNIEGFGEDWQKQIEWLRAFAAAWRKLSSRELHLPALSPSGNYLDGIAAYTRSGIAKDFDVVDAHFYANGQALPWTAGKPLSITEFNGVDPALMFRTPTGARECVWFILGGTPDQSQYNLLNQASYYQSFKQWKETPLPIPDFTSPNHDGPRESTVGVVIHATLGPSLSPDTEYTATINWFQDPASQVSAHAVVGPGGQVHRSVRTDEIAWHCRASNKTWLGIEMAHPFSQFHQPIAPDILDAAARIVAGWCHDFEIPIQWSTVNGLAEHREMPTNSDGHQDVGGPFDRADFLARVKKFAGEDELTNEQKTKLADHLNILWGETKADTIKANPAESERACHERIVAIKELLGVN